MANNNAGSGWGLTLAIVFTVLKLTGVISWSWWWVLCPVWIPLALVSVILLIALICRIIIDR